MSVGLLTPKTALSRLFDAVNRFQILQAVLEKKANEKVSNLPGTPCTFYRATGHMKYDRVP